MKMRGKSSFVEIPIVTPFGKFIAHYSGKGLAGLKFPKGSARRADRTPRRGVPTTILRWHRITESALKTILAGRAAKKLPPLDLSGGTPFQQNVWRALQKIPRGKTRSYGEIARQIGKPEAVRAVGGACGVNPIPIFVPCHRVLAANKKLGGYSGGLNWKRKLLAHEGIALR
jgi:methylated-DNA-[protein]-cysteine S-methyltransferase